MNSSPRTNRAVIAAQEAEELVAESLKNHHSFLLEAGAGAGKTYSLVEVLKQLIEKEGAKLRKSNQRIACITYTNAAADVIRSRIDSHPLVFVDTIHAFCWALIKRFQPVLRSIIAEVPAWKERVVEVGGIRTQLVEYDLGYRRFTPDIISLNHDDVLLLFVKLLQYPKFQELIAQQCPYMLIDEYQDTDEAVMGGLCERLIGRVGGPLIGLFGDHWQRIYDKTCGRIAHQSLRELGKKANFRSATRIVDVLNKMRPELPQAAKDENLAGSAGVFHTNDWGGERRSGSGGGHWTGDLPSDVAHAYLDALIKKLESSGWDMHPSKTKILMLTHNVLASEQGYGSLMKVFQYADSLIRKEDPIVAFLCEMLEPACAAFSERRYGEMFAILHSSAPPIMSNEDKVRWFSSMERLIALRREGTIGEVLNHMCVHRCPRLPDAVFHDIDGATNWQGEEGENAPRRVNEVRQLLDISYREVIALDKFINGHTPFATKHSVKGDEFENVLVVVGRGWNKYNFGQFLEWAGTRIPAGKQDAYERSRNLFYVCCSRPRTRLALLFTQELSSTALDVLEHWFDGAVESAPVPR